ncbi:sorting nexin [Lunasporangiospora selenospora]|uniref:Sorting nexin MVP1 n=1 Tax=Lunasporangiospora selenospora TaxID=979761 RepID=A0A9P6KBI6_9FUNG|nr:sorting nexin [Lunasporangiospora selenospora]
MAQKNMDLTIENLIAHREDLPFPHLPGLDLLDFGSLNETNSPRISHPVHTMTDPWRNSVLSTSVPIHNKINGNGYPSIPPSSSSTIGTVETLHSGRGGSLNGRARGAGTGAGAEASEAAIVIVDPESMRREMYQWLMNVDVIRITFAPEKEGIFLFKHVNYIVESKNRQKTVVRRYSDFYWMLEVLAKKYPYRTLPNLPPKRLGVTDEAFLERRLRGLTRFMNALMRHPILRDDPLVVAFLTEPVEFAVWKKDATISTEDEFSAKLPIPRSLTIHIPENLDAELESVKKRLPASIEYYRSMVHLLGRVQKRAEANAADFTRYSIALNALADCERKCHVDDCYNCGQLSQGYNKISVHLTTVSNILDEQARATQRGMVESLKRHRDLLVSVSEMLHRRDQSRSKEGSVAEMLKKRIVTNEAKLKSLRAASASSTAESNSGSGVGSAAAVGVSGNNSHDGQIERVANSIDSDRADLELHGQRVTLIQHTLWMEISYFHKSHAMIAAMYQTFVHEQMKTSQSMYDNWRALSPVVHDLPMDVNGFN